MSCHCIGVTSRIWPSQAKLELTNHDLSKKPFLLRFMRFFSSAMEKEMRGKVIIYRSRGEHPTIQCEFLDYFDLKKYILKQKCMYGFLTFMLINALLFCPWNYEKMTLKSRIHTKIAEFFSTALTAQTSNYVSWKQLTAQLIYNDFDERYTFGRSCASHALEETTKSMDEFSWWALQKVQSVTFHFLKFVNQF